MIESRHTAIGEDSFTCACDSCGTKTSKSDFPTPGDASDQARKEGFSTKYESMISPATWHCKGCQDKTAALN